MLPVYLDYNPDKLATYDTQDEEKQSKKQSR
jgi:hypothetical protein